MLCVVYMCSYITDAIWWFGVGADSAAHVPTYMCGMCVWYSHGTCWAVDVCWYGVIICGLRVYMGALSVWICHSGAFILRKICTRLKFGYVWYWKRKGISSRYIVIHITLLFSTCNTVSGIFLFYNFFTTFYSIGYVHWL